MKTLALVLASSFLFACSKPADPTPAATASSTAASTTSEASTPTKPLSAYLGAAKTAKVSTTGSGDKKSLNEAETKAFLAKYDLSQVANGPIVRCPSTETYTFEDGSGTTLGSIGLCGDKARFDGPDKTVGGIKAR